MNTSLKPGTVSREAVLELNRSCNCLPLPRQQIDQRIARRDHAPALRELLRQRQNLFAATAVMVADTDRIEMISQINAIEAVARLEGYQRAIAGRDAHPDNFVNCTTRGIFMSYDFHLTPEGPRLIEVNTNAGGAFIVHELLAVSDRLLELSADAWIDDAADIESAVSTMICREWQHSGRSGAPRTLAIVDIQPSEQYLYPEMCLAVELFARHGIETRVVDVGNLQIRNNRLQSDGWPIDMVYNRLTDFLLLKPECGILRQAWLEDLALVSPGPSHHALYADKRNLTWLGDFSRLRQWGATETQIQILATLPVTVELTAQNAADLWAARKDLFFKPSAGFGAKAAYRGSKLTHRTWESIITGDYIAQQFVAPAERCVAQIGSTELMKFDVRVYTYASRPLLSAARIYQGQTTNFRTPGGGFAPVVYLS